MDIVHFISWILLLTVASSLFDDVHARARGRSRHKDALKARISSRRAKRPHLKNKSPNIIIVMTDDQDEVLGSMKTMTKTLRILRDQGAHCVNSFVSSPMCCPSRSSFLTGMYPHNHNVYTNNVNCSSPQWQRTHEMRNFATYLSSKGYRTGYFGKYLNEYNGSYIPPGWAEWVGLVKNSRFYNYTINFNGKLIKHADNYYMDYFTDLIANDSVTFLKQSKQYFRNRPVLMVLSVPAPHGPEDAAPQYQHMFFNNTDHRTPSWNYAPNEDKQWLLKLTGKMEPIHQKFTDMLHRKRLQTLQSVDDLMEKIFREVKNLGELENTYMIFTSDHGYHLGQYGLVKGKAMPYDFDVRVPLYVRGPGISPGTKLLNLVANIDLAPTILDMAGIEIPEHMDGRSFLKLLTKSDLNRHGIKHPHYKKGWRDSVLLTRGKVTHRKLLGIIKAEKRRIFSAVQDYDIEKSNLQLVLTRRELKLVRMCQNDTYKAPCKEGQELVCNTMESGDLELSRCNESAESVKLTIQSDTCMCPDMSNATANNNSQQILTQTGLDGEIKKCRVLPNNSIQCERELYQSAVAWKTQKDQIDEMILFYKQKLENLKGIRKHLKKKRPIRDDFFPLGNSSEPIGQLLVGQTNQMTDNSNHHCQCYPNEDGTDEFEETEVIYGDPGVDDDFEESVDIFDNNNGDDIFNMRKNLHRSRKERRRRKKAKRKSCHSPNMNCFTHDNDHWKTPPFWSDGPFCFCPNSGNCTYWCMRTINETHNFLYCEFITKFISFYNMTNDPHQLRNAVYDLNYGVLQQLHEDLNRLRDCKGTKACSLRTKADRAGRGSRHKNQNRQEKRDNSWKSNWPKTKPGWSENWKEHRRALRSWG